MAEEIKNEVVSFRIIRVKDIAFSVNEKIYAPPSEGKNIQVRIDCTLSSNPESSLIIIEIMAFYYYDDSPNQDKLASITVQSFYDIVELKKFFIEEELMLPPNLITTLVSISLSHTRALFSKSIDGTAYNGNVLPIINPEEFAKYVFPHMFVNADKNKVTALAKSVSSLKHELNKTGKK